MKERIRIGKANKDRTIEKQKCFSQSLRQPQTIYVYCRRLRQYIAGCTVMG